MLTASKHDTETAVGDQQWRTAVCEEVLSRSGASFGKDVQRDEASADTRLHATHSRSVGQRHTAA